MTITTNLLLCAVVSGLLLCGSVSQANAKSKSSVRTITGCLSQGDSADEFLLTGRDASTWEIRSSKSGVALAPHVGHTITATGVVSHAKVHNMKEDTKETAADAGVKKEKPEHGHLQVTAVKMVSDSCQK
jgi:hypothetical protein